MTGYDAPVGYDEAIPYDGETFVPGDPITVSVVSVHNVAAVVGEGGETWDEDILTVSVRSKHDATVKVHLTPAAVLAPINEWPIERQAHVMPALSAVQPRMRPHVDYDVERGTVGALHVWVNGVDVTYLRNVPTIIGELVSSAPLGDERASIEFPQIKPWDIPGTGDLWMLTEDAPVEVALIGADDSRTLMWEGFVASFSDYSGDGRETYTVQCQGELAQAMLEPWDPPLFLNPTDIGTLVANALNSVTGRRWLKIPKVATGILSTNRGSQQQSAWQYVQDLLAVAWTDDYRQWTIQRVASGAYRLQLKAATGTVHWTFTKGAHGVGVDLIHDAATRRDAVYGSGVTPNGGVYRNWKFPFLDRYVPPVYPRADFANLSVGMTDAATDNGRGITQWQTRMRDLGYNVRVDGVMNSSDTKWVRRVQKDRGITVDGSLGPQTWAATFDMGPTEVNPTAVRRPFAAKSATEPYLYAANGARKGKNPAFDKRLIRHAMPEVFFGTGVWKRDAYGMADAILDREGTVGAAGTVTVSTDPHEAGASRLHVGVGDNLEIIGHRGSTVVQVSQVSHGPITSTFTVDEFARDALSVEAILERNRDARKNPANRPGVTDNRQLDRSHVTEFESESKAGVIPRVAVNGNSGLWTVLPIYVGQTGVAQVSVEARWPKAEFVMAVFGRPIRPNTLANLVGDPLASKDGWYDMEERLREKHGMLEVFGRPDEPGGYFPRTKSEGGALKGVLRDFQGINYYSHVGGYVWIALFTSRSTFVEGRLFPAVPS